MTRSVFPNALTGATWDRQDPNARQAWISVNAPRIPWEDFIRDVFTPEPGEHMYIAGSTGSGKTHLMNSMLFKWPFVTAFATKKNDSTMERLINQHSYERFTRWWPLSAKDHPRRVIWPPPGKLQTMTDIQKKTFSHAMEHIWDEGGRPKEKPVGWAVAMDEAWWFAVQLGLAQYIKIWLQQGRSNGISLLAASQRPAYVPTELYSQTTHLCFFKETERRNIDRIGEINHKDSAAVKYIVNNLEKWQILYVNADTGFMCRTRTPFAHA
jgi:energy-coupling factor transporter ATP-binding protein EcfA2